MYNGDFTRHLNIGYSKKNYVTFYVWNLIQVINEEDEDDLIENQKTIVYMEERICRPRLAEARKGNASGGQARRHRVNEINVYRQYQYVYKLIQFLCTT